MCKKYDLLELIAKIKERPRFLKHEMCFLVLVSVVNCFTHLLVCLFICLFVCCLSVFTLHCFVFCFYLYISFKFLHSEVVTRRCFEKRPATLLTKRLQYRCFPVNFAKLLGTLFLQNTSGGCFCTF